MGRRKPRFFYTTSGGWRPEKRSNSPAKKARRRVMPFSSLPPEVKKPSGKDRAAGE